MKLNILSIFLCIHLVSNGQSKLIVPNYIQLPKDSIESTQLITDLNKFISAIQKENKDNEYVLHNEKIESFILIDELKEIEKSNTFNDPNFFKPYLTNVIKDNDKYAIQISHIGTYDSTPYLRTAVNFIAHKTGKSFVFSSPLLENTKNWKSKTIENSTFYYQENLNNHNALKYAKMANEFDKKLGSNNKITKIYCTNNRRELLKLIGVDYKLDYNGIFSGNFSALNNNEQLIVLGNNNAEFNNFDTHDLWHDRLSLVVSRRKVNKPVDEGCAYLYGGSWGMSWETIFKQFKTKIASNKKADWKYYKENKTNFGENQAEHLIVDYVINALLIKKIEKEKSFSGVWKLLNCGVFEKGNENYYTALENLTGITKNTYNQEVWKLIHDESLKLPLNQ